MVDCLYRLSEDHFLETARLLADVADGQSLVPLLQGEETGRQHTALGEILCEGAIAPCFMIRRGRYKYIYSEPDPDQLFDLEADPHELTNLATEIAIEISPSGNWIKRVA